MAPAFSSGCRGPLGLGGYLHYAAWYAPPDLLDVEPTFGDRLHMRVVGVTYPVASGLADRGAPAKQDLNSLTVARSGPAPPLLRLSTDGTCTGVVKRKTKSIEIEH